MKTVPLFLSAIVFTAMSTSSALAEPANLNCNISLAQPALSSPVILAQSLKSNQDGGGDGQGPTDLAAPERNQTPVARIKKGECCAKVSGGCATICDNEDGCTGVGDCITNPN